jgi:HPt (histidine-containing phosphotransfer) domain-containing protein/CheY-like chemotaxis protein
MESQAAQPRNTQEMNQPQNRGESQRVLLAEHGATVALLASRLLERNGFTVTSVDHEASALAALAGGQFDAALVDSAFPGAEPIVRACAAGSIPVLAILSGGPALPGATAEVSVPIAATALTAALRHCLNQDLGPAIDLAAVAALWGGPDGPGFQLVVGVFINELAGFPAQVEALLAAGDRGGLERQAHSIKGAASQVGANLLAAAALRLEQNALTASDAGLHALAAAIEAASGPTIAGLRALFPNDRG